MSFSFLSWNVEHFKGGAERLARVAAHIRGQNPDIFGLLEVENVGILQLMQNEFPDYTFGITDGPESMEILVGCRTAKFAQSVFTQKREFKAYNPALRPGAMLSVRLDAEWHNLLFLHTDSGTDAAAFGNRFEMFDHVWRMKKALDNMAQAQKLIVLGDLNTMGLFYPTSANSNSRVAAPDEIGTIGKQAGRRNMALLPKTEGLTFNNGTLQANLDHVLASDTIQFAPQGADPQGNAALVAVRGWNQLAGAAREAFIGEISDHSSLFASVA